MKKLIAVFLSLVFCFSFASCGKREKEEIENLEIAENVYLSETWLQELLDEIRKDRDQLCYYVASGKESPEFFPKDKAFLNGEFDTDDLGLLLWKYEINGAEEFIKRHSSSNNPLDQKTLAVVREEIKAIFEAEEKEK